MMAQEPLIGREHELLALELALRSNRLVTVTGAGGCGKSRLARELAVRLTGQPAPVESRVVELATIGRSGDVVDALVRGLGVRERAGRTQSEVLLDRVSAGLLVLVIDNCEHVVDEVGRLVLWLMDGVGELRILTTSREPLGLSAECVFPLAPLGLPDATGDVAAVVRSDAGRLFVDRAASANPGFVLSPSTARAVVRICHELDGLPLALALAAAGIKRLSPREIAEGLARRGRLAGGDVDGSLPQHRSVRASLDWSYGLLDDAERRMLRGLSTFSGGWDAAAAQAFALGDGDKAQAVVVLVALEQKGLIVGRGGDGEMRWSFCRPSATMRASGWRRTRPSRISSAIGTWPGFGGSPRVWTTCCSRRRDMR